MSQATEDRPFRSQLRDFAGGLAKLSVETGVVLKLYPSSTGAPVLAAISKPITPENAVRYYEDLFGLSRADS